MCNRARFRGEPETLIERFGASWAADVARPNRDPQELYPDRKAYVIREEREKPGVRLGPRRVVWSYRLPTKVASSPALIHVPVSV